MPATNAMNISKRATATPVATGEGVVVGTGAAVAIVVGVGAAVAIVVGTAKQRSVLMNLFLCFHQYESILCDTNIILSILYINEFLMQILQPVHMHTVIVSDLELSLK